MLVRDVMTPSVMTVTPETPILEAARLMLSANVSGLPVTGPDGTVFGIVSEYDLVRKLSLNDEGALGGLLSFLLGKTSAEEFIGKSNKAVREVMCHPPVLVRDHEGLEEAFSLMHRRHVKRLPVIKGGKLVGILARRDLLRAAVDLAEKASA